MANTELTAHRAAVLAALQRHQYQAAAEVPAPTIGGVEVPLDQRHIVLEALTNQKHPWTAEEIRYLRAESVRQIQQRQSGA